MRSQRIISKFRSWHIWWTTSLPINGCNDMRDRANTNDVGHASQRFFVPDRPYVPAVQATDEWLLLQGRRDFHKRLPNAYCAQPIMLAHFNSLQCKEEPHGHISKTVAVVMTFRFVIPMEMINTPAYSMSSSSNSSLSSSSESIASLICAIACTPCQSCE